MPEKNAPAKGSTPPRDSVQGTNDGRWYLIEHSLYQAKLSIGQALTTVQNVTQCAESDEEWSLAEAVEEHLKDLKDFISIACDQITQHMAGTETAERIGGYENG